MSAERFELALKLLKPAQWEQFEQLASRFLSADFPDLRTTASPSGDEGRDAELFSPSGIPTVLVQYSVAADWRSKILRTAKRLVETRPDTRVLIYASNQVIGASADTLKSDILKKFGFLLDVRDRNWFLERQYARPVQEAAAEQLIRAIAEPYLRTETRAPQRAAVLSGDEAHSALVYLEMQWEDQGREKGLTKLAFESLVLSAVRETDQQHRIPRARVRETVRSLLPSHPSATVDMYTDSALARLSKNKLRHWKDSDEFALASDEAARLRQRIAEVQAKDARLLEEIRRLLIEALPAHIVVEEEVITDLLLRVKRVLEKFLLTRGERLSASLNTGSFENLGYEAIEDIIIRDLAENVDRSDLKGHVAALTGSTVRALLLSPTQAVQSHLRSLADTYTLFSFLSETPDVQKVVSKMFSHGEIWFDTSFLLPVLLEELLPERERRYTAMVAAANEAGLSLRISPGILEELETHMYNSLLCARMRPGEWKGNVPFLLSGYTLAGGSTSTFAGWVDQFRGDHRPEDDLAEYLSEVHNIVLTELEEEMDKAPRDLVYPIDSAWRRAHEARRRFTERDSMTQDRLIRHDVETFVGVIQRRSLERDSPFGYTSWLITFDRSAEDVVKQLRADLGAKAPSSPLMSADFLECV